jgi:non-specific protein-tyrosine kinase
MLIDDAALADPPLHATEVEGLHILTSGPLPPNPVDVLASAKMDRVIHNLLASADFLLFDMPPVLVGADASVLGRKLGGVLLVVQANQSRRDDTARAKAQLERIGVRLLGAVLLDAPAERASARYR